jgi:hypothetical protein
MFTTFHATLLSFPGKQFACKLWFMVTEIYVFHDRYHEGSNLISYTEYIGSICLRKFVNFCQTTRRHSPNDYNLYDLCCTASFKVCDA